MLDVSIGLEEDVTMSQWKVGIIGLGHVGAHVLQSLALQGYADDFVLYDLESNRAKAEAERQDVHAHTQQRIWDLEFFLLNKTLFLAAL